MSNRNWPKRPENQDAPFQEFFSLSLEKNELAFIYLGYAGIILRSKDRFLGLDLGKECILKEEVSLLESLEIQLYSHSHWDHWDSAVSRRILEATNAPIIAEPQIAKELTDKVDSTKLLAAKPGKPLHIEGFEISAITGVHGRPITLFHVKWSNFSIFHGADSGYVPLEDYPAEIAFLPVGTPSPTCSPENALKWALDVKPKVAVAMHGEEKQQRKFNKLIQKEIPEVPVFTPKPNELLKIQF